jgi:hypothetical protein
VPERKEGGEGPARNRESELSCCIPSLVIYPKRRVVYYRRTKECRSTARNPSCFSCQPLPFFESRPLPFQRLRRHATYLRLFNPLRSSPPLLRSPRPRRPRDLSHKHQAFIPSARDHSLQYQITISPLRIDRHSIQLYAYLPDHVRQSSPS